MPIPTWTQGQVIGASDVNNWFVPQAVYKPSTTGRSNTTTRAQDPDLIVTVAANCVYHVTAYLSYSTNNISGIGFAFGWVTPSLASPPGRWGACYRLSGDAASATNFGLAGTPDFDWTQYAGTSGQFPAAATPGDNQNHSVQIEGTLFVGSTSGSFYLSWAPDSVNGNVLNLNIGSKLLAQRIA
jgi:hypothetical protein